MSTSLIEIVLFENNNKRFFAKLENENKTGSFKDRLINYTLDRLLEHQTINSETTIVEASSGNTGIAIAQACKDRNLKAVICMANHISLEKKQRIVSLGAELKEFDVSENKQAEIEAAIELGKKEKFFHFDQFANQEHINAYKQTLAKEVIEQLQDKNLRIDFLVAGIGSGASLRGLGEELKERYNPNLEIIGISPTVYPTKIEGINPSKIKGDFPIWENRLKNFETDRLFIADDDAINGAKELKKEHNIFVGPCSGAVYFAALNLLVKPGNYLLLFSDSGDRYVW
ncbi:MAG: pyridoxal-phosphate dependent enzyme [Bdellovibrionales bacterium]|nr:pyridoxal-phosphate dependent enzyme [Bdellovibrionales bacterium]